MKLKDITEAKKFSQFEQGFILDGMNDAYEDIMDLMFSIGGQKAWEAASPEINKMFQKVNDSIKDFSTTMRRRPTHSADSEPSWETTAKPTLSRHFLGMSDGIDETFYNWDDESRDAVMKAGVSTSDVMSYLRNVVYPFANPNYVKEFLNQKVN